MTETDVLVVGAGPTGLTLAAQLAALGCHPRVIDERPEPWRASRALMLHPRTLELLRPLGITPALLRHGRPLREATLHSGRHASNLTIPELAADTPYPYLVMLPQARFEAVLQEHLADHGVDVEWGVRLRDYTDGEGVVVATAEGSAPIVARYLVGCDGAGSTVRRRAGIGFRGGDYRAPVCLVDLDVAGPTPEGLHVIADREGIAFLGAVGEYAPWRMLTTDRDALRAGGPRLLERAGIGVDRVAWSRRFPQRYALADRYRSGRVFLAGDAAHVHSPAGGQGMNTGVGDAVNLGWKLAFALLGLAGDPLLDTYETERRALARWLIGLTSLIYIGESSRNPVIGLARRHGARLAAPLLSLATPLARFGLRVLGQLSYAYGRGPAAQDATPRLPHPPRPGQRLGDATVTIDGRVGSLHQCLASPGMHLLLAGFPVRHSPPDLEMVSDLRMVKVHHLDTLPDGATGTGYFLVRPDGYIGLRGGGPDLTPLHRFLAGWR